MNREKVCPACGGEEVAASPFSQAKRWSDFEWGLRRYLKSYKVWLGFFLICLACACSLNSPYPKDVLLHDISTAVGLLALYFMNKRYRLSVLSFSLVIVFLCLHIFGAQYLYSYVPYDSWTDALCGVKLSEVFNWQRNHYDRLVHFAYGLCFSLPCYEIFKSYNFSKNWSLFHSLQMIISTSAVYELIEFMLGVVLSPENAERYNGMQGDIWDAHKDIALASLAAAICLAVLWLKPRSKDRFDHGES